MYFNLHFLPAEHPLLHARLILRLLYIFLTVCPFTVVLCTKLCHYVAIIATSTAEAVYRPNKLVLYVHFEIAKSALLLQPVDLCCSLNCITYMHGFIWKGGISP